MLRTLQSTRPNVLYGWSRAFATEAPTVAHKASKPQISAAVILNRSPVITRNPTRFERAYYAYQGRIRRALSNPFPSEFYFGEGSLLRTRFNIEERQREKVAFGPRFKELTEDDREQIRAEKVAAAQLSEQEGKAEDLMSRDDQTDDVKSLDRQLERNIYLLLLCQDGGKEFWRFPQGSVHKGELLHQAAQRDLHAEVGEHIDSWIVSRNPIGVHKPLQPQDATEQIVFFYKGHIMAGQAQLQNDSLKDFAWLTKEEIEKYVDQHYWNSIKHILPDF